jgi:HEAT repeat protein|nr:HEAT repeat domain-containing protein [Kofleriaceae bacterium]
MTNMTKLAAVAALVLCSATPAFAGHGGSSALINQAVASGSTDAIIAEVEKTESLICEDCMTTVTSLVHDNRYAVREVAAWWIAKRPGLMNTMATQFVGDLANGDANTTRDAADFLGAVRYYNALPALQTAMTRSSLTVEAKLSIVHAVGYMAHVKGNPTLQIAMGDASPQVRAAAVKVYRDVLNQTDMSPVQARLGDTDASVRAEAAAGMGAFAVRSAVPVLIQLVTQDKDSTVRRNAAWALGKIGDGSARAALVTASGDSSPLVRGVAKAAISSLR